MILPTLLLAVVLSQPEPPKRAMEPSDSAIKGHYDFDNLPREEQDRRIAEARQTLTALGIETWKAKVGFWTAITVVSLSGVTQGLLFYVGRTRDRNNKIREALANYGSTLMETTYIAGQMEAERGRRDNAYSRLLELEHEPPSRERAEEESDYSEIQKEAIERLKELETRRTEMQERLTLAKASMLVHSLNKYTDQTVGHIYLTATRPKDKDEPPLIGQTLKGAMVEKWLAEMRRHPITFQGSRYWALHKAGRVELPALPLIRPVA